jgi:hypothetical protein
MGWPVEWLKRMISADEFDLWCRYYERRPFDDENVHHVPVAALTREFVGMFRGSDQEPLTLSDFLVFHPRNKSTDEPDGQAPNLDFKLRSFFERYNKSVAATDPA